MQGVFVGVTFFECFLSRFIIKILVQDCNTATPSCGLYYYLVQSLLLLLSFVPYIITAKWHKLRERERERERHINIQAIMEKHYERYFDQEEEYIRQAADARLQLYQ